MSMEYLEALSGDIECGITYFACQGTKTGEWYISKSKKELQSKAQRSADACKYDIYLYRLIASLEATPQDSFLVVRKLLESGPRGEPNIQWALVDTKDAAEIVKDVSQGPTPFFGAVIQETFKPVE